MSDPSAPLPAPPPIEVRYLDDAVVVVSKPGGLLVHRSAQSPERDVLLTRLRDQIDQHLYPVHRLDRATSGLIVFALTSEAARALQESWGADSTEKRYVGLCRSTTPPTFASDRPLTRHEDGVRQEARTTFRTLGHDRGFSLVSASLDTGRRHQIRRHLAHLGAQLVGDTTYGKGGINRWLREEFGLPRLFLHAARLCFRHPSSGEMLELRDRVPVDLDRFLGRFSPPLAVRFREQFLAEAEEGGEK